MSYLSWIQIVFTVLLGLIVGSFLNSVIYRLQNVETLKKIVGGRSFCPECKTTLRFWDLIPLFSFFFLRAKCRYCKKPISWQYPIVELAVAGLFLFIYLKYGISWTSFLWAIAAMCAVIIFAYDFIHLEFPVIISAIGIVAGLGIVALKIYTSSQGFIWGETLPYVYGALVLGGFLALLVLISWERWMGIGDIWIGVFVGLLLGFPGVIVGGFLAFLIGSIFSLVMMALKKSKMKDKLAFGPFLIIGGLIALIWGQNIINWYLGKL